MRRDVSSCEPMEEIPQEVRDLVRRHVTSGDHLEILMRMFDAGEKAFSVDELRRVTHIAERSVVRCLDELSEAGIVRQVSPTAWQYGPRTVQEREALDKLAQMYHQRPVTLVRLVYERPSAPLKSFSDAFRLRDTKDD